VGLGEVQVKIPDPEVIIERGSFCKALFEDLSARPLFVSLSNSLNRLQNAAGK
jgi:hypothetical protein